MSAQDASPAAEDSWGSLVEPIHHDVPAGAPPWRDNAYLCFWDPAADLYGALHVSTSPNAEGRRSRLSVHCGDEYIELIDPLESGTFNSRSVIFDTNDRFAVRAEEVAGELIWQPRFAEADYTGENAPKAYGGFDGPPLQHFQRGATVTGWITVNGRRREFNGYGVRDRTWGYRDESAAINELIGFMWMFPTYMVTTIRLLTTAGTDQTLGFRVDESGCRQVEKFTVTRDAAGLFRASTLTIAGADPITVRADRRGGHWCPLGAERTGPVHSAFDEFSELHDDRGGTGFGMTTQGVVRRLY